MEKNIFGRKGNHNVNKIELNKAEPLPEWKRWDIEGVAGEEATLTTPDGRFYHLLSNEKLILDPREPEGDRMPEAFIDVDGTRMPFEEWAKNKPISE